MSFRLRTAMLVLPGMGYAEAAGWLSALIRKRGAPERWWWVVAGYVLDEHMSVFEREPFAGGV